MGRGEHRSAAPAERFTIRLSPLSDAVQYDKDMHSENRSSNETPLLAPFVVDKEIVRPLRNTGYDKDMHSENRSSRRRRLAARRGMRSERGSVRPESRAAERGCAQRTTFGLPTGAVCCLGGQT